MQDLEPLFLSLFSESRHSDVVSKAKELNILPGSNPTVSKVLAASLFSLSEYSQAHEILCQLESVFGDNLDYLNLFATNCRRLGNFEEAHRLFIKGLTLTESPPPQLLNNFANLLIDLSRYDEAKIYLNKAIVLRPDYEDALSNLKRLENILEGESSHPNRPSSNSAINLSDPLLLSFTEEEVSYSDQRYFDNKPHRGDSFIADLPSSSPNGIAYEKIDAAFKANADGQHLLALKMCSSAYAVIGPNGRLFDCISDSYISLKKFIHAEICLLHAIAVDSYTPSRCFNLVSLSLIKGDNLSATFYVSKLTELDPSHPHLERLRSDVHKHATKLSSFDFVSDWVHEPTID